VSTIVVSKCCWSVRYHAPSVVSTHPICFLRSEWRAEDLKAGGVVGEHGLQLGGVVRHIDCVGDGMGGVKGQGRRHIPELHVEVDKGH